MNRKKRKAMWEKIIATLAVTIVSVYLILVGKWVPGLILFVLFMLFVWG